MTTQQMGSMVQREVRSGSFAESRLVSITKTGLSWIPGVRLVQGWLRALAFRAALKRTYTSFACQEEEWVDAFFDEHFIRHYAAPLLNRYLQQDTDPPSPVELATVWADQFRPGSPAKKYIAKLTPVAADFLASLEADLQRYPVFRDLGDS